MSSPAPVKLFAERMPLKMQMHNMTKLREENPNRAREVFLTGQQMIEYAANGELRALKKIVFETEDETGIFPYFGSKMFKESLVNGHLLVSLFIIENGYPFKNKSYPSAMHEVLETDAFPDFLGAGVVGFLATQGCDVNRQSNGTWLTPLHIAVRRNLVQTVATLISLGADVNAVGKNDVMPLSIAQQQQVDIEDSEKVALITKMLEENGAKATVRELLGGSSGSTGAAAAASVDGFSFSTSGGGVPFTTSSMVSVKGGAGPPVSAPRAQPSAGTAGGFVRFTGGASGPAPAAASAPQHVFTSFSSSTAQMNGAAGGPIGGSSAPAPAATAIQASAVNLVSTGVNGQDESNDREAVAEAKAFTATSDDGGMMFSTS